MKRTKAIKLFWIILPIFFIFFPALMNMLKDGDIALHKTISDSILNNKPFVRPYYETYPKGIHYLTLFLGFGNSDNFLNVFAFLCLFCWVFYRWGFINLLKDLPIKKQVWLSVLFIDVPVVVAGFFCFLFSYFPRISSLNIFYIYTKYVPLQFYGDIGFISATNGLLPFLIGVTLGVWALSFHKLLIFSPLLLFFTNSGIYAFIILTSLSLLIHKKFSALILLSCLGLFKINNIILLIKTFLSLGGTIKTNIFALNMRIFWFLVFVDFCLIAMFINKKEVEKNGKRND